MFMCCTTFAGVQKPNLTSPTSLLALSRIENNRDVIYVEDVISDDINNRCITRDTIQCVFLIIIKNA